MRLLSFQKERLATLFLAGVVLLSFYPSLRGSFLTFGGDDTLLHLPIRAYSFAQLKKGVFPLWTSHLYTGYPLFASGQAGLLYPLNLIFLFLDPATGMAWSRAAHLFLGGSILFFLLRKKGSRFFMSLSLSLFWMLVLRRVAGIAILHLAIWMPLLSECWLRFFLAGKRKLLTPILGSLLLFAGNAQYALMAHLFLIVLVVSAAMMKQRSAKRILQKGFVLAIAEVGMAGVQLFPLLTLLAHSERAHGLPFSYAFQGTTPLPIFFLLLLLLAAVGIQLKVRKQENAFPFWGSSLFALILSSSLFLPFQRLLRAFIPLYAATRIPEKWLLFCWLGLFLTLGIGFPFRGRRNALLFPLLLIALFLNLNPRLPIDRGEDLATLLAHQKAGYDAGKDFRVFAQREALFSLSKKIEEIRKKDPYARWTNSDWEVSPLAPNDNLLYRISLLEGYLALVPRYFRELSLRPPLHRKGDVQDSLLPPFIADSFGVRFFLVREETGGETAGIFSIRENRTAYPLWYLAEKIEAFSSIETILKAMRNASREEKKRVFLLAPVRHSTLSTGTVQPTMLSAQEKSFTVRTQGEALFVFSEWHYPGWRAFVDGKETTAVRVNAIQQGIWLREGIHRVRFSYFPHRFLPLFLLSLSTLSLFLFASLSIFQRERRKG